MNGWSGSHANSYTAVSMTLLPDSLTTFLVSYSPGLTAVLGWGWVAVSPSCDSDWYNCIWLSLKTLRNPVLCLFFAISVRAWEEWRGMMRNDGGMMGNDEEWQGNDGEWWGIKHNMVLSTWHTLHWLMRLFAQRFVNFTVIVQKLGTLTLFWESTQDTSGLSCQCSATGDCRPFTFLYFCLVTSRFLYFEHEASYSEQERHFFCLVLTLGVMSALPIPHEIWMS